MNQATPGAAQEANYANDAASGLEGVSPRAEAAQDLPSLKDSADQALKSVSALYTAVDGTLTRSAQQNPYGTLATAAAVGFVLGGGLTSPIGQVLVRLSMRSLTPTVVNAAVQGFLDRS